MPRGPKTVGRLGAACAAALGAALLAAPLAAADDFVPVPDSGVAGRLSLSSSIYPLKFPVLRPAETFSWQIGLTLTEPTATSTLQVAATGTLAATDGYVISVDECAVPWQGMSGLNQSLGCPTGAIPRIPATRLADLQQDVRIPLSDLQAGTAPYLRFILSQPASASRPQSPELTMGIGVTAVGDDDGGSAPAQPPEVPLGDTGADFGRALWAGGALFLLGLAALAALRRPRHSSDNFG